MSEIAIEGFMCSVGAAICERCLSDLRSLVAEVMRALRVHFIIPFYIIIAFFFRSGGQARVVLRNGFSLHMRKVLCGPAQLRLLAFAPFRVSTTLCRLLTRFQYAQRFSV